MSGGQSEIEASKNLNEINKLNDTKFLITFSYGRGLQASALKEFGKNQNNIENIQKAFNHRAKMNGLSSKGEWSENLEKESWPRIAKIHLFNFTKHNKKKFL